MGTKNNPGDFDCYANAEPDEPMFVLLARDPLAPSLVRDWAIQYRQKKKLAGTWDERAEEKFDEAIRCAYNMEDWRKQNR